VLAVDAVGIALERQRPAGEVGEERRRDARVVGDEVALGEAGLRPQDLVEVRELQPPPLDHHLAAVLGQLLDDLDRRLLVRAQPLERRVAQHPVARQLGELDLREQQRLDPLRPARPVARRQRRAVGPQGPEPARQVVERLLGEPRADLAGVAQLAALGIVAADEQRADPVLAPALAGLPADDDELVAAQVLDLDPGAGAAAGLVTGVHALGDQSLEP
jgi:hypothetical protein